MTTTKLFVWLAAFALPLAMIQSTAAKAGSPVALAQCTGITDLVAFVAGETGYQPMRNCPPVSVTTDAVLKSMLALTARDNGEEPMAMYVPAGAEILLGPDVDLASALGRSYLVHELVHAYQDDEGVASEAPCLGWLEEEAYRVQASYLRIQGFAKDASTFAFLGLLQGACGHAYHPEMAGK